MATKGRVTKIIAKTIPGKVQTYLASGRPVLGAVDGEAAKVINESGAGLACPSGDAAALARIVRAMALMTTEQREAMGGAGRQYYEEHFARDKLMTRLESLMRAATLRKKEAS